LTPQTYVILIKDGSLALAVGAALEDRLACDGHSALALVPARGLDFTDAGSHWHPGISRGRPRDFSRAPQVVALYEDGLLKRLESLGLAAYVGVPQQEEWRVVHWDNDAGAILLPVGTARDLVEAVACHTPWARHTTRVPYAVLPRRREVSRPVFGGPPALSRKLAIASAVGVASSVLLTSAPMAAAASSSAVQAPAQAGTAAGGAMAAAQTAFGAGRPPVAGQPVPVTFIQTPASNGSRYVPYVATPALLIPVTPAPFIPSPIAAPQSMAASATAGTPALAGPDEAKLVQAPLPEITTLVAAPTSVAGMMPAPAPTAAAVGASPDTATLAQAPSSTMSAGPASAGPVTGGAGVTPSSGAIPGAWPSAPVTPSSSTTDVHVVQVTGCYALVCATGSDTWDAAGNQNFLVGAGLNLSGKPVSLSGTYGQQELWAPAMSSSSTVGVLGTYSQAYGNVLSVRGTAQVEIPTDQIPALLTTIARAAVPLLSFLLPDQSSELSPTLSAGGTLTVKGSILQSYFPILPNSWAQYLDKAQYSVGGFVSYNSATGEWTVKTVDAGKIQALGSDAFVVGYVKWPVLADGQQVPALTPGAQTAGDLNDPAGQLAPWPAPAQLNGTGADPSTGQASDGAAIDPAVQAWLNQLGVGSWLPPGAQAAPGGPDTAPAAPATQPPAPAGLADAAPPQPADGVPAAPGGAGQAADGVPGTAGGAGQAADGTPGTAGGASGTAGGAAQAADGTPGTVGGASGTAGGAAPAADGTPAALAAPPQPADSVPAAPAAPADPPPATPVQAVIPTVPGIDPMTGLPITSGIPPISGIDPMTGLPTGVGSASTTLGTPPIDPVTGLPPIGSSSALSDPAISTTTSISSMPTIDTASGIDSTPTIDAGLSLGGSIGSGSG
jgi:hypothetical protein